MKLQEKLLKKRSYKNYYIKAIILEPSLLDRIKVELKNLTFETDKVLNESVIKVAIITDHLVIPIKYIHIYSALAARECMDEVLLFIMDILLI